MAKWTDDLDRVRYSHLKQILPLQKQLADLEVRDEKSRRRRDAQFPMSVQEYRALQPKPVQHRVARFLVADAKKQDAIMTEFGWAWRQVLPLKDEYEKNVGIRFLFLSPSLNASVIFVQLEFKVEVQEQVREIEASDPRRRQSLNVSS